MTYFFGENNYNLIIPKIDGIIGAILAISFSLFPYVYVLTRASFHYQSNNYIEVGKNLGLSSKKTFSTNHAIPRLLGFSIAFTLPSFSFK